MDNKNDCIYSKEILEVMIQNLKGSSNTKITIDNGEISVDDTLKNLILNYYEELQKNLVNEELIKEWFIFY